MKAKWQNGVIKNQEIEDISAELTQYQAHPIAFLGSWVVRREQRVWTTGQISVQDANLITRHSAMGRIERVDAVNRADLTSYAHVGVKAESEI